MRRASIRLRLTAWYALIFAVVLAVFTTGVYFAVRNSLREQLDDSLATRALLLAPLVTTDASGRPSLDLAGGAVSVEDSYVRLYDASGELRSESNGPSPRPEVPAAEVARARSGETRRKTIGTGDAESRVRIIPVEQRGAIVGVLEVGESAEEVGETMRSVLIALAVAAPIALLAGVGGAWWLSSRALSPIDRITRAAGEISTGGDLRRRLDLDLPDDEVGRLARTLDAMIERLDAAFERQRRFTADASHQLRTPLTALRGQIDVVLGRPRDSAEYERVLRAADVQVARMNALVESLLTLARADTGVLRPQRDRVEFAAVVEAVAEQVRGDAAASGLELRIEHGPPDTFAAADESLLAQALLNLADNAVRYTRAGAVTLGWTGGARPSLFVRDTGPGIPSEQRERVFERFYRVDPAAPGGTGLGLSIVRAIADAHGWDLTVQSRADGTTITLVAAQAG